MAVVTDADGKFAVLCPTSAIEVSLWIHIDGRCSRYYESSPPLATDLGDIPLVLGYGVKGRLIDENGAPMEGVRVCLPLDLQFPGGGVFSVPSKTAADGSFAGLPGDGPHAGGRRCTVTRRARVLPAWRTTAPARH